MQYLFLAMRIRTEQSIIREENQTETLVQNIIPEQDRARSPKLYQLLSMTRQPQQWWLIVKHRPTILMTRYRPAILISDLINNTRICQMYMTSTYLQLYILLPLQSLEAGDGYRRDGEGHRGEAGGWSLYLSHECIDRDSSRQLVHCG